MIYTHLYILLTARHHFYQERKKNPIKKKAKKKNVELIVLTFPLLWSKFEHNDQQFELW
jgi:hypothetical protein